MNSYRSAKNLGMLLLGMMLLVPAGFAQDRDRDRDWSRDSRRNDRQGNYGYGNSATERGYQDGLRQGQLDRNDRNHRNHGYRTRDWKDGDRGYNKSMGSKGQYKQAYRDGYERGYQDAFRNGGWGGWNGRRRNDDRRDDNYPNNGYPNSGYPNNGYPNNGGYSAAPLVRAAEQNGYTDGAFYAQQDRSKGNSFNPTGAKGYRDADHGYDSRLGSKADFQRIYREAFVRSYQQSYGNVGYRR